MSGSSATVIGQREGHADNLYALVKFAVSKTSSENDIVSFNQGKLNMGLFEWLFTSDNDDDVHSEVDLQGPGDFAIDVVGESHYQMLINKAVGGRTHDGHETIVNAVLILVDTNPHDSNAVLVQIKGKPCGYLDREYAITYRNMLARMGRPTAKASCKAMIVGGWDRGEDDQGYFGVRLDLPYDE